MADNELIRLTASEAVAALATGDITPLDLVDAAAARIEAVDGALNALPTLCLDRGRDHARRIMTEARRDAASPWLGGLPMVVKDLSDVAGVRTTYGSPIYAEFVPSRSNVLVERLEASGAIVIAKSNTPEFGAGANTFNEVFGKTRNPWNTAMTCGGSSGGSAVALAAGMAWLATGSDLGGSLRTPASFCGVVGLRPSPGRIARWPTTDPFDTLGVQGPMARTVRDVALMLDAMAGQHGADPLSRPAPDRSFSDSLDGPAPRRVAYSADLGYLPVDPEVASVCRAAAQRLEETGAIVEEACPDLTDAPKIFQTLRAANFATSLGEHLKARRDMLKPDVVWNVEKGLALSADEISQARRARAQLYERTASFFRTYDLLLTPAALVPPFDVDQRYVERVGDHVFENYVDWLAITFAITLTSCPALSLPCGRTDAGLPVGLQMVAPVWGEQALLAAAHRLESLFDQSRLLPIDPGSGR